jgi:hypothetical protein
MQGTPSDDVRLSQSIKEVGGNISKLQMGLQKIIATKTKVTTVVAKDPAKMDVPVMGEALARVKTLGHSGPIIINIETSLKDGGKEPDLLTMIHPSRSVGDHCYTWMTTRKKITLAPKKAFDPN